jgi:hypothetical protein
MRLIHPQTKNLNIKLSIQNEMGIDVKSYTLSVDDFMDMTKGRKCLNLTDDIISNMLRKIFEEQLNAQNNITLNKLNK